MGNVDVLVAGGGGFIGGHLVGSLLSQGLSVRSVDVKPAEVCQHLENQRFPIPADLRAQLMQLPPEMRHGFEVSRAFDFDVAAKLPPGF